MQSVFTSKVLYHLKNVHTHPHSPQPYRVVWRMWNVYLLWRYAHIPLFAPMRPVVECVPVDAGHSYLQTAPFRDSPTHRRMLWCLQ